MKQLFRRLAPLLLAALLPGCATKHRYYQSHVRFEGVPGSLLVDGSGNVAIAGKFIFTDRYEDHEFPGWIVGHSPASVPASFAAATPLPSYYLEDTHAVDPGRPAETPDRIELPGKDWYGVLDRKNLPAGFGPPPAWISRLLIDKATPGINVAFSPVIGPRIRSGTNGSRHRDSLYRYRRWEYDRQRVETYLRSGDRTYFYTEEDESWWN